MEFLVRPIYAGQKDAACLANSAPLASLCDSQTGSHPVIQGVPASSGSKFPGGEEAGITPEANGRKRHIAVDPPGPDYEIAAALALAEDQKEALVPELPPAGPMRARLAISDQNARIWLARNPCQLAVLRRIRARRTSMYWWRQNASLSSALCGCCPLGG